MAQRRLYRNISLASDCVAFHAKGRTSVQVPLFKCVDQRQLIKDYHVSPSPTNFSGFYWFCCSLLDPITSFVWSHQDFCFANNSFPGVERCHVSHQGFKTSNGIDVPFFFLALHSFLVVKASKSCSMKFSGLERQPCLKFVFPSIFLAPNDVMDGTRSITHSFQQEPSRLKEPTSVFHNVMIWRWLMV